MTATTPLQPSLFDPLLLPVVPVRFAHDKPLDERFAAWLSVNPHVLAAFIREADTLFRHGLRRIGGKLIVEHLRYLWAIQTQGDPDGYALNNSYTSRLVRAAIERRPDLAGLFETRELRS